MDISIRTRSIELTDELRDLIARRLEFALDALAERVANCSVYLADVNGPRGGATDKECHVSVGVQGVGEVVMRGSGPTALAAFGRATDGLKYRVSERIRTHRHHESESIRTASGG